MDTQDAAQGKKAKPAVDREPPREEQRDAPRWKMKARPNWEGIDVTADDSPDRLKIDPSLIPEGMSAMWVTNSVYGQDMSQHRATFEKRGWTPVHQEDFDGRFDGMFMPKGAKGEIMVDGLVLMMRPKELTERASHNERRKAAEVIHIKEQQFKGGDIAGVSLDTQHKSALGYNKINKTIERIEIPTDAPGKPGGA